jgi:hypothetical protein
MKALYRAAIIVAVAGIALFVVEGIAIVSGEPTISEGMQRLVLQLGNQLLAGLSFLLGLLTGWFIAHFTSQPPE